MTQRNSIPKSPICMPYPISSFNTINITNTNIQHNIKHTTQYQTQSLYLILPLIKTLPPKQYLAFKLFKRYNPTPPNSPKRNEPKMSDTDSNRSSHHSENSNKSHQSNQSDQSNKSHHSTEEESSHIDDNAQISDNIENSALQHMNSPGGSGALRDSGFGQRDLSQSPHLVSRNWEREGISALSAERKTYYVLLVVVVCGGVIGGLGVVVWWFGIRD